MKKAIFVILLLLSMSILTSTLKIPLAWTSGTIYIRADGSIDPPTAPIRRDGDTYTFASNISDTIIVQRSSIVVDGAGYMLQGLWSGIGIDLSHIVNVTVKNTVIKSFATGILLTDSSGNKLFNNTITDNTECGIKLLSSSRNLLQQNNIILDNYLGIKLESSSFNTISDNIIADNYKGINLDGSYANTLSNNTVARNQLNPILIDESSNNVLSGNTITNNYDSGVWLWGSSGNELSSNTVTNNYGYGILLQGSYHNRLHDNSITGNHQYGIYLRNAVYSGSTDNTIFQNTVANNGGGIGIGGDSASSGNVIYHNNFIDNVVQVSALYTNAWDDDYPSGGNFWSDYTGIDEKSGPYQNETGSDGIGDTPYIINDYNRDRYPLMNLWKPPLTPDFSIAASPTSLTIQQGNSAESAITVLSIDGFSQPVQLSMSGAPSGVTATFNPEQVTPPPDGSATSVLTISVDVTVAVGTYTLTVTGTNGTLTHSVDVFLCVVALPKFVLIPSEGWQRLELFVPTWRRSTEYSGKVVFEIFNKRDMWYIIRVYKRMPDKTWQEIIPDEFLSITGPYLGPYSVKTFVFPYVLQEGDEIKIEVWNDLNDNALCALWALDFTVRALLGISISPQITNWPEIETKLLTFYNGYLEAIGNLRLGKWKLGLLQLCRSLVGSAASREFAEIINLLGVQTTAATIATIAFKIITSAFWLIPNIPLWWPLFENTNKEPFMEDVTFTVKGAGTGLPNLKVIEGLTIVQSEPYYVGETIDAQFTLRSEDESPVTLHVLMVGGQGPRGEIQDFTFKTNITINPGQSYTYEGKLQLLSNGTYHFFIAYQTPEGEWVTDVPTNPGAVNSIDINILIPTNLIGAELCSPWELRVYDSQGRVTGLLNGEEVVEIPNSFYYDGIVVIYYPNDSYKYQVKGVGEGEYNITLGRFSYQNLTMFEAIRIPISNDSLHQFTCDWDALSINEEGVLIHVDSDGDNFFEKTFPSDNELTAKEFMSPAKATFTFNAFWEGVNYPVTMFSSNSSITNFNFDQSRKQIMFQLSGETGESGYCNVSIPKALLKGEPWTVKLNGTNWGFTLTENETYSFIYIIYTFSSVYEATIEGTWVVPEFSPFTIIALLIMLSLIAVAFAKKSLRKFRKIPIFQIVK